MPVARKHLRSSLSEGRHLLAGTLHDLRAIDPKKKIERGFRPLGRQRVEQGLKVVQAAFVEHLAEFPDKRTIDRPILLSPGRVAYARPVAVTIDLA
jgi:hypothetical protein